MTTLTFDSRFYCVTWETQLGQSNEVDVLGDADILRGSGGRGGGPGGRGLPVALCWVAGGRGGPVTLLLHERTPLLDTAEGRRVAMVVAGTLLADEGRCVHLQHLGLQ